MGRILKTISLTAYCLIILTGEMIGLPFLLWLIWTSFEFGNVEQVFAILGLTGLILNFTKYGKSRIIQALSFVLMLAPVIKRLTETGIEKFNYLAFQVPLLIFVIVYLILIIRPKRNKKTAYNNI